jgi:hypothetical protein
LFTEVHFVYSMLVLHLRNSWRYQRDNQKLSIKEGQITQRIKDKGQTKVHKTLEKSKDWATWTLQKPGMNIHHSCSTNGSHLATHGNSTWDLLFKFVYIYTCICMVHVVISLTVCCLSSVDKFDSSFLLCGYTALFQYIGFEYDYKSYLWKFYDQ